MEEHFKRLVLIVLVFTMVITGTPVMEAQASGLTSQQLDFVKENYEWTVKTVDSRGYSGEGAFAQICYESGYGTSGLARTKHNYGGFRARSGSWMSFASYKDFVYAYCDTMDRLYSAAKSYSGSPMGFVSYLNDNGYCGDPGYMNGVGSVYQRIKATATQIEAEKLEAERKAEEEAAEREAQALREQRMSELEAESRKEVINEMAEEIMEDHPIGGINAVMMAVLRTEEIDASVEEKIVDAVAATPTYYLGDDTEVVAIDDYRADVKEAITDAKL